MRQQSKRDAVAIVAIMGGSIGIGVTGDGELSWLDIGQALLVGLCVGAVARSIIKRIPVETSSESEDE